MDSDQFGLGADDDDPGLGAVLRRSGSAQKCAVGVDAMLHDCLPDQCPVDVVGLFASLRSGRKGLHWKLELVWSQGGRPGSVRGLLGYHTASGLYDFPGDVCRDHAGPDHWRVCRADAVHPFLCLHAALGDAGLRSGLSLGLGRGWVYEENGCAGFRRRHGGSHQCRYSRPGRGAGPG